MNAPASIAKGNPLWDFTVWAYAQPGVEKACLALQNRFGADINMVMFCLWLAYRGTGTASLAKFLSAALKLSREWQRNLVEPLRSARENLKNVIDSMSGADVAAATALRERIKQSELDMEQLQMLTFHSLVSEGNEMPAARAPAEQKDDALNNLTVYFTATGVKLDPLGQTHVMRILTSVFGS